MDEAAEDGKSIRNARWSFAHYKTKMTSLRRPDGVVSASRRAVEKVIYDFYWDLFDSHIHLPSPISGTTLLRFSLPKIKAEHLKSLPPVIVRTLATLFTQYLSECKVPTSWETSKTVSPIKKGD
uniref:Transposase n=1 Tax=Haemonchus contortus TaxID=6289 RepID=A0A7I4Z2C9_HAECO